MGWRNTHKLAKAGGRETAPPTPQPPPDLAVLSVVREGVWRSHRGLPGFDTLRAHCGAGAWEVPCPKPPLRTQCFCSGRTCFLWSTQKTSFCHLFTEHGDGVQRAKGLKLGNRSGLFYAILQVINERGQCRGREK